MSSNNVHIEMKDIRRPTLPARAATEARFLVTSKTTLATIVEVDENDDVVKDPARPPMKRSWSEKVGRYLQESLEAIAFAHGAHIDVAVHNSCDDKTSRKKRGRKIARRETPSKRSHSEGETIEQTLCETSPDRSRDY